MSFKKSLVPVLFIALGATSALAQSTGGSPADPNTLQNQQPGPSVKNPTDPAAGSNPAARAPTAPMEEYAPPAGSADDGASSGEGGFDAPAGNPSDPTTDENQQPGPSVNNPTDPAAGANPDARLPSAPRE